MRFGSLFSGIGGMDLGLEMAGMECAWQVELDEWRRGILAKHWPNVPRWADVHDVAATPVVLPPVDLVAGGDPCQANSLAGSGLRDSHDPLVADSFLAVVDALRPRFVLRENPPSRRDAPWPWWKFRSRLEALGYAVLPFRLRACCLGALHRRERVFLLGELLDRDAQRWSRLAGEPGTARREECSDSGGRGPTSHPDRGRQLQPQGSERDERRWLGDCGCLSAGPEGAIAPVLVRGVHDVSCRLDRAKRVAGLGDSVMPAMAQWIGERIVESVRLARRLEEG